MKRALHRSLLLAAGCLIALASGPAPAYEEDRDAVAHMQAGLQDALRPEAGILLSWLEDDADISVLGAGAEARLWPVAWLPLRAQVMFCDIEQEAGGTRPRTQLDRTAGSLWVENVHVLPEVLLTGRLTAEDFDGAGDDLVGGGLAADYLFENGTRLGAAGNRDSFWTRYDSSNPRQYPRLTELSLIDPGFTIDTFSAHLDWATFVEHRLRVEAAVSQYEDDNEQLSAYAHYQFPLTHVSPLHWIVLRPNIYYETFDDHLPAYFSPDYNVSAGCAVHTIRKNRHGGRFELEANPLLIFRDDALGNEEDGEFGLHLVADASAPVWKRLTAGLGAFYYYEDGGYDLWRLVARAGCRF